MTVTVLVLLADIVRQDFIIISSWLSDEGNEDLCW